MMKLLTLLSVFSLLVFQINSTDKVYDIHNFITTLQDEGLFMETSLRSQFNTYYGERVKAISTLTTFLKNIQNGIPVDLSKYESIDVGLNIVSAGNMLINIVRKNVLYSIKATMDDGKTTFSNYLYDYIMDNYGFIDNIALGSKNLFNSGKGCVMDMEVEIKNFIDLSGKKFMECIKNVSISSPILPPKFITYQTSLTQTFASLALKLKEPFWYIWIYSNQLQNDTAAAKFNTYCQTLFPTILDIGKTVAQSGLDIVNSLNSNVNAFKNCFNRLNSTVIDVKRHEVLNKINDVCSKE